LSSVSISVQNAGIVSPRVVWWRAARPQPGSGP
jgi:hypothetical protein